ncbi:MAG TPA: AAA family ATPase, partial [Myxococcaceae bacterium]|nr:AAA family ATPase [Myxococcaceae bacterium]
MDYLRVLGDFTVLRSGAPVALPQSRKTRALLAYLVITGRPHQRERLCEIFWDGPHDPKAELRWSLSKIRQILGESASACVRADRNRVQIIPGVLGSDYEAVRQLDGADLGGVELQLLEHCAEAFRGPFLSGLSLPRCPDYEAWRAAVAHECEVSRLRLLRAVINRLADRPERALPHAHVLSALLPEDRDIAGQVEQLVKAARFGAAQVEVISGVPHKASQSPLPRLPPLQSPIMSVGIRAYATVYAAELHEPPAHFERMDPEVVEQELARLRHVIRQVVERHGGTVIAQEMAEFVAVFGAPISFEDHAARACSAALEAHAAVRSATGTAIGVRAGLDSGEVILPAGYKEGRTEAIGLPLRTARLLMRSLQRSLPSATGRVRNLTGSRIQFSTLEQSALSGPSPDGSAFQIIGENRALSRWALRAKQGLSKLVGREQELMILDRMAAKARAGYGQIAGVVGIPGVGKSRLTHEFLERAAGVGMGVLESAAVEFEALMPYRTIKKLLWSWLGLDEAADRAVMVARAADRLSVLDADRRLVDPLHYLLDLPESAEWAALDPYERVARIRDSIRLLVEQESRLRPVVILIEDMHWADAESEAAFAGLVDSLVNRRVLLLLTYRPEYSSHAFVGAATQIKIGPLDDEETGIFLGNLLGEHESIDGVKQLLRDRADGVPLFLEELVNDLVASDRIVGTRGSYRCLEAPAVLAVPSNVRTAIAARVDRLDPLARNVLQLAAVIGREVRETLLLRVLELPSQDVASQIKALRAGEYIYEQRSFPSPIYAFKHALVHEVAYASMLLETRRQLHERVLRALEEDPATLDEDVDALAEHALRARVWEAVVRYCVLAADRSVDRSSYVGAARFLDEAAEAIEKLEPTRQRLRLAVDVRTRMRPAYEATGRFEQAFKRLEEARQLAVDLGDVNRQMHVLLHHSYLDSAHGRTEPAIKIAQEVAALARSVGDERYAAEADLACAQALAQRYEAASLVRL